MADPLSIVGVVLAAYKDVFFLAKGIYRLASSAQYYQSEHQALLTEFYNEFLYLRVYHHVFFVDQGGRLISNKKLNEEVYDAILEIFRSIGSLFSEYKGLAMDEDMQYQRYNIMSQEKNAVPLLEFSSSLEDLTRPSALPSVHAQDILSVSSPLAERMSKLKDQPVLHLKGWKWSLFQKKQMARIVAEFREHNQRLRSWESLLLSSRNSSARDLHDFSNAIRHEPDTDDTAFIPHVRLRQIVGDVKDADGSGVAKHRSLTPINLQLTRPPSSRRLWVEHKTYPLPETSISVKEASQRYLQPPAGAVMAGVESQVDQLARVLLEAGSYNFHTLPFHGFEHQADKARFTFYFDYPAHATDLEPVHLNELLRSSSATAKVSLGHRFEIALTIAKALGAFHDDGWVHKSVMSQSVIFFRDDEGIPEYSKAYLTGFELSRREFDETSNTFDSDPDKNLYRHPARQGSPTAYFNRVHDVYALGVVLLEIGLWQTVTEIRRKVLERRDPGYVLSAEGLRDVLLRGAKGKLGHLMGDGYKQAVATCLSGELEPLLGQDSFGLMFRRQVIDKVDPGKLTNSSVV